jgi:glucose-1-phosphate thymidylyltransferase
MRPGEAAVSALWHHLAMRGLILAGGSGTRLRPITHTGAKQLVPVAGKPILFYGLEHMAEAGIREVGMVVGDTADEIIEAVGDGSRWGLSVTYLRQEAPLGLAHAVLIARDFLGDDDFVMYLGDNLLRDGITESVRSFEQSRKPSGDTGDHDSIPVAQILLAPVDDPSRFGIATLDDQGSIVELVEKPEHPASNLALVGVYLFDPSIHEAVRAIKPSPRGELEITDAIQWLIDRGDVVSHGVLSGWWLDTGKLAPLLEANRLLLETIEQQIDGEVDSSSFIEGRVIVCPGAVIEDSTVRGPVVIGPGARITRTHIGPFTTIEEDCVLTDTEIDHSIVLGHSQISGVSRITDSLIGRHAVVNRTHRRPKGTRLMVGDHSLVDLTD